MPNYFSVLSVAIFESKLDLRSGFLLFLQLEAERRVSDWFFLSDWCCARSANSSLLLPLPENTNINRDKYKRKSEGWVIGVAPGPPIHPQPSFFSLLAARKSYLCWWCNSANLSFWCKATFASGSRKSLVRVWQVWCFSTPSGVGHWSPILSGSGLTLCYSIFMVFKILANQATKGRSAVSQPLFLPGAAGQLEVHSCSH